MYRFFLSACLLTLALITAQAQTYQLVMLNEDTAFAVKSGPWDYLKNPSGSCYHNFRFYVSGPGTGSSVAVWTLDAIPAGTYQVDYYVNDASSDGHSAAEYVVESDTGVTTLTKSQYLATGWQVLGTFAFTNAGRITQTDANLPAGRKVYADALRLTFQGTPTVPTINVVPPSVSICIDDLGGSDPNDSSSYTYQLFNQAPDLTYAVMPGKTYTMADLVAAQAKGIETITHQPMEFMYEAAVDPTGLYTYYTDDQNLAKLRANLAVQVPYAVGLNNHTGSKFSRYEHGCELVIGELKTQGLYFYDSRTISDSVAYDVAQRRGLLCAERDLFIDGATSNITRDNILALATRAKYAPTAPHCGIGHQYVNSVPGILAALPLVPAMGVSFRPISRVLGITVESDFQPDGCTFTTVGPVGSTTADMMARECKDGSARTLPPSTTAAATATFTPALPKEGNYRLFVGYAAGATNCDTVRVIVNSRSGASNLVLNQQADPNRWHYMGTFPFNPGTGGNVVISNALCSNPAHAIRADAVKFVYDGPAPSAVNDWHLY